jgi:hypothetical protein
MMDPPKVVGSKRVWELPKAASSRIVKPQSGARGIHELYARTWGNLVGSDEGVTQS